MQQRKGGAYEVYIQTPCGEGPRPGGTEQGRGPTTPWPGGGSGAISKGFVSPGRGDTAASPASVLPTQTGGDAEQEEGRVPEAKKVSAPLSLNSGA